MTVSVDHHAQPGRFRLQIETPEIVQHIDRQTADRQAAGFDDFSFRQGARPRLGINVPADRRDGRNLCQRFEDFRSANVARMQNAV